MSRIVGMGDSGCTNINSIGAFYQTLAKISRIVAMVVKDETVESLVRSLAQHLDSWGRGSSGVRDRPKTVALKWRRNGR